LMARRVPLSAPPAHHSTTQPIDSLDKRLVQPLAAAIAAAP
jgi:hypothetical protein